MTQITLRQIRYFAVLAKALQFRRAAEQLGISQPSLSLQIDAFETALGTQLVERRRNGLILTMAGRAAALRADQILGQVDALEQVARPTEGALSGTLRLGTSPTLGPYLLPRALRHLHQLHPELKLVIRDAAPKELTEDLMAGRHDLILTELPVARAETHVVDLFREPLLLAVSHSHPLAQAEMVRHADLVAESMISLSADFLLHRQILDLCETVGATLRDEFEGTSLDALRQMVSLEMGVTLLPALYVDSEVNRTGSDVAALVLRPPLYRQIGLVWRSTSGQPRAFQTLAGIIREVARSEFGALVSLS